MQRSTKYGPFVALVMTMSAGCSDFFDQFKGDGVDLDDAGEASATDEFSPLISFLSQARYHVTYEYRSGSCGLQLDEGHVGFGIDPIGFLDSTWCKDHQLEQTSRNTLFLDRECIEEDDFGGLLRTSYAVGTLEVANERGDIQGLLTIRIVPEYDEECQGRYWIVGIREPGVERELPPW